MQNLARFQTSSDFDREYLRNGSRYPKSERRDDQRLLPHSNKKSGELWSTNYRELYVSLNPPKLHFSGDYISALRGCWALKFSHALEIDKGLLAHTHNGDGGPPKAPQKFKGEHGKLGLKFRVCAPITLGVVGVPSRNLHTTCHEAAVFKWAQFWGKARPLKFGKAKFGAISNNFRL